MAAFKADVTIPASHERIIRSSTRRLAVPAKTVGIAHADGITEFRGYGADGGTVVGGKIDASDAVRFSTKPVKKARKAGSESDDAE